MAIRTPSRSIFLHHLPVNQDILKENRRLIEQIDRRKVLRGALSLGALTFLTGCNVSENDQVQKALRYRAGTTEFRA
jgi:hypothetical protein